MRRTLLSDMRKAWACLHADRLGLRLMEASIRAMLSGVELRTANQVAFYTWQSLLHATALPIDTLQVEMGLSFDSVHREIRAESL